MLRYDRNAGSDYELNISFLHSDCIFSLSSLDCAFNVQAFCYCSNETGFRERSNRIEHLLLLMSISDTIIQGSKEMVFKYKAGVIQSAPTTHLLAQLNPGFSKMLREQNCLWKIFLYDKSSQPGLRADVMFTCSIKVQCKEGLLLYP